MRHFILCLVFFFVTFLISCEGGKEIHWPLTDEQVGFLTTIPVGTTVKFDANGTVTTAVVGELNRYTSKSQDRGSTFAKPSTYYTERGDLRYDTQDPGLAVSIQAIGNGGQDISVYYPNESVSSSFSVHFDLKVSSRTINGIEYSDVVLGIDRFKGDTLFWKKDVGIIGWKRAKDSFTTYRIF